MHQILNLKICNGSKFCCHWIAFVGRKCIIAISQQKPQLNAFYCKSSFSVTEEFLSWETFETICNRIKS